MMRRPTPPRPTNASPGTINKGISTRDIKTKIYSVINMHVYSYNTREEFQWIELNAYFVWWVHDRMQSISYNYEI